MEQAILSPLVAWRLFWLTHSNRQAPERRVRPFWPSTSGKRSTWPFIAVPRFQLLHQLFVRRCAGLRNLAGS